MNQDIENLIELALADGQITEKERSVIVKKAIETGVELDEIEMVIAAKIYQQHADKLKPMKDKMGNLKTCPACGATVTSMLLNCSSCNHEFTSLNGNATILNLIKKLEQIDSQSYNQNELKSTKQNFVLRQENNRKKNEIIINYPIPNTKEDILEFITYSISKLTNVSGLDNPWATKADEVLMKAKLLYKNDKNMLSQLEVYEKEIKKRKKLPVTIIIVSIIFIMVAACFVIFFGNKLR